MDVFAPVTGTGVGGADDAACSSMSSKTGRRVRGIPLNPFFNFYVYIHHYYCRLYRNSSPHRGGALADLSVAWHRMTHDAGDVSLKP